MISDTLWEWAFKFLLWLHSLTWYCKTFNVLQNELLHNFLFFILWFPTLLLCVNPTNWNSFFFFFDQGQLTCGVCFIVSDSQCPCEYGKRWTNSLKSNNIFFSSSLKQWMLLTLVVVKTKLLFDIMFWRDLIFYAISVAQGVSTD